MERPACFKIQLFSGKWQGISGIHPKFGESIQITYLGESWLPLLETALII
jgi:hypothetical protein